MASPDIQTLREAFRAWLALQNYYTGHNVVRDRKHELIVQRIGYFLLGAAVTSGFESATSGRRHISIDPDAASDAVSGEFHGGGAAMRADGDLQVMRDRFDFLSFKTEYSSPVLILGAFVTDTRTAELRETFANLSRLGKALRRFGLEMVQKVNMFVLLIYHDSALWQAHKDAFYRTGTATNKINGVSFRSFFVNVETHAVARSAPPMGAGWLMNLTGAMGIRDIFDEAALGAVLELCRDIEGRKGVEFR